MKRSMAVIERELAALIKHSEVLHADARELAKRAEVIRQKARHAVDLIAKGVEEDDTYVGRRKRPATLHQKPRPRAENIGPMNHPEAQP